MVAKRSTKMGKVMPYVDVRSASDIPKFEHMLQLGPVFVLVYADWCGHCTRFKQNMWDEVAKSPKKGVNTAAVHYDMVDKTSMKNANIEGYPTLFEVKKATPKQNVSTPVPTPQSKEELEKLVGTEESENLEIDVNERGERMIRDSTMASQDTFTPEAVDTLPPNVSEDTLTIEEAKSVQGGGARGGSLLESLLKVSADTAHAIVLTGSAMEISRRFKKRKTKRRSSGKKKTFRRR
jgi:thiol-disulfide isomerase/thioredoxin